MANVAKPGIVKKNLLHDEDSHCLAQLRACLHDAKAKRNNLGSQEEVDNIGRVVLDKGSDNTEGRKT